MTIALHSSSLVELSQKVRVPQYDRTQLSAGIIHVGVGNFHRAHQAMYLHKLFELGEAHDWAICGAGIKLYDESMRNKLAQQDWLTTVVELEENSIQAQVCGSMIDFLDVDASKLIAKMAQQSIKIVSLTITEGGYFIDPDTGLFDTTNAEIQSDIKTPDQPKTVFGIIIQALKKRMQEGVNAFTVMSCDNVPHNGEVTKKAVLGLAKEIDTSLAYWIESHVSFPNSMVDCIAPAVTPEQIKRIDDMFGIQDQAPVVCESFRQWVLEDNFVNGRPALEKVGVQFVDDVAPYELMKLRVLNGGHAALAYPAGLMGIEFVHQAMRNKTITRYLEKLITDEAIPSLPTVAGIDLQDYLQIIKQRFSNSEVKDTIERLYQDGQNRLPKFILPTISDNIKASRSINGLSLVIALWCTLCMRASDPQGNINLHDEYSVALSEKALQAYSSPATFIGITEVFGGLGNNALFASFFGKWLHQLKNIGVNATLESYINNE